MMPLHGHVVHCCQKRPRPIKFLACAGAPNAPHCINRSSDTTATTYSSIPDVRCVCRFPSSPLFCFPLLVVAGPGPWLQARAAWVPRCWQRRNFQRWHWSWSWRRRWWCGRRQCLYLSAFLRHSAQALHPRRQVQEGGLRLLPLRCGAVQGRGRGWGWDKGRICTPAPCNCSESLCCCCSCCCCFPSSRWRKWLDWSHQRCVQCGPRPGTTGRLHLPQILR